MGMTLLNKSGIFWPQDYGLAVGDTLEVILVAAGDGSNATLGGSPGSPSFFGPYATARPGAGAQPAPIKAAGLYNGGPGGFIPGAPAQGGTGASPPSGYPATAPFFAIIPTGNAGGGSNTNARIIGANGASHGASGSSGVSEGGGGYGAGAGSGTNEYAGAAGEILYYSHIINEDDFNFGIPITVGNGFSSFVNKVTVLLSTGEEVSSIQATDMAIEVLPGQRRSFNAKFHELYDGTFFMMNEPTPRANFPGNILWSTQLAWTANLYVKFPFGDAPRRYADVFPNFPQPLPRSQNETLSTHPFYCNGYYIFVAQNSPSNSTTIYWVRKSAIENGGPISASDFGSVVYATTSASSIGFTLTDMVRLSSSTQLRYISDWTPEALLSDEIAVAGSFSGPTSSQFLVPISRDETPQLFPCSFSIRAITENEGVPLSNRTVITDYKTGATASRSLSTGYMTYPIHGTLFMGFQTYYGGSTPAMAPINYAEITASFTSSYGYSQSIAFAPAQLSGVLYQFAPSHLFHFSLLSQGAIAVGDLNVESFPLNNILIEGYAGIPGQAGTKAGAGGCCMITW